MDGQMGEMPALPSLTVKVHPYGLVLRFPGARLHPEDATVLGKLQPGTFYEAYVWVGRKEP